MSGMARAGVGSFVLVSRGAPERREREAADISDGPFGEHNAHPVFCRIPSGGQAAVFIFARRATGPKEKPAAVGAPARGTHAARPRGSRRKRRTLREAQCTPDHQRSACYYGARGPSEEEAAEEPAAAAAVRAALRALWSSAVLGRTHVFRRNTTASWASSRGSRQ